MLFISMMDGQTYIKFKLPVYIGVLTCFSRISHIEDSPLFCMECILILNDLWPIYILQFSRVLPVAVTMKTLTWNLNGTPNWFQIAWTSKSVTNSVFFKGLWRSKYRLCFVLRLYYFFNLLCIFLPSYFVLRWCWTDETRLQFAWRQH